MQRDRGWRPPPGWLEGRDDRGLPPGRAGGDGVVVGGAQAPLLCRPLPPYGRPAAPRAPANSALVEV